MTSGLETERVYCQRKRQVREKTRKKRKKISGEPYDINKGIMYI